MKKDKFHITNLIKELIINIDKNLTNFPKKEIELKNEIKETSYHMLEIAYEANATYENRKRKDLQEKMIAKIKYIDFLINLCYDKQIINGKKISKIWRTFRIFIKICKCLAKRNQTKNGHYRTKHLVM